MKAAFYTLGCKVNQYDTQEMISSLKANGYEIVDSKDDADIYIINSCTVTAESSRKSRQAARRYRKMHPGSIIVITGCYTQAFSDEFQDFSDVDIVLGNNSNDELIDELKNFTVTKKQIIKIKPHKLKDKYSTSNITSFDGHTRAFVKIQDGCNRYCSYCIIPKSRGFSRSRPLREIERELCTLNQLGYKEIVFVGINLSSYGQDIGGTICDVIETAEKFNNIERIRLGSLEPDHITDDVIDRLSKIKKFCPQFHLSLQSGSDRILKRMNRHYTADEYYQLCQKLKQNFSDISITTDIIVGFPGETEEDFNDTIEFCKKCRFMKVHVFPFSPRKGTPAYGYTDKINNAVKAERCSILQNECDSIRLDILKEYIGTKKSVLFESPKGNSQQGYTENYTPVIVNSPADLCGKITEIRIIDASCEECIAELL